MPDYYPQQRIEDDRNKNSKKKKNIRRDARGSRHDGWELDRQYSVNSDTVPERLPNRFGSLLAEGIRATPGLPGKMDPSYKETRTPEQIEQFETSLSLQEGKQDEKNQPMPYEEKLSRALQMVPGLLKGDVKALFQQLTSDPKFVAALVGAGVVFAGLQAVPGVGAALDVTFLVVFGLKAGIEIGQFFYEAYQAKDADDPRLKVAAEKLKSAIENGGAALLVGFAGGFKTLRGLLNQLNGGKQAEQTAQVLSQLKPQQIEQFEKVVELQQAGKAEESSAALEGLRKSVPPKTFEELEKIRIVRQDNDFAAQVNHKDKPKSHIDSSGSVVPANAEGKTSIIEHIYGVDPAKSNSPHTSFMTEKNGIAKAYGSQEIELNIARLRADIKSGKLKDVKIFTPKEILQSIKAEAEKAAPGIDLDVGIAKGNSGIEFYAKSLGLSKKKTEKTIRLLRAYLNTTRDGEFLIEGIIPKGYYTGPYPAGRTNR
jgi:hypothetical protein